MLNSLPTDAMAPAQQTAAVADAENPTDLGANVHFCLLMAVSPRQELLSCPTFLARKTGIKIVPTS